MSRAAASRRIRPRLLVGSTAAALAATTLLSGCSGDAKAAAPVGPPIAPALQGDPTEVVAAAAGRSVGSPNAGVTLTVPVVQEGQLTAVHGEGTVDFPSDKLKLIVPNALTAEQRKIGRSVYVLLPEQAAPMLGGKKWVTLDLDQVGAKSPDPFNLYAYDPEQLLTTVTAVQDATLVGSESVRDAPTTHFRGTLDPAKVAGAGLDPTFARAFTAATKGAATPVDVWLDDAGFVRKLALPVPPPESAVAAGPDSLATVELFDYGTADVAVTPPPAHEVADSQQLDQLTDAAPTSH